MNSEILDLNTNKLFQEIFKFQSEIRSLITSDSKSTEISCLKKLLMRQPELGNITIFIHFFPFLYEDAKQSLEILSMENETNDFKNKS